MSEELKSKRYEGMDGREYVVVPASDYDQLSAELSRLKAGQGEAVAWARQCDLDESDPAIFVARERVEESGYVMPLYLAPPTPAATQVMVPRELMGRVLDPETGDEWSKSCKELRALLAQHEGVKP